MTSHFSLSIILIMIIHSLCSILLTLCLATRNPPHEETIYLSNTTSITQPQLEILSVHRNSDQIVAHPSVQAIIATHSSNNKGENSDSSILPALPTELSLPNYTIMKHPVYDAQTGSPQRDQQGKQIINYLIVQKASVAKQQNIYIDNQDIEIAQACQHDDSALHVILNDAGAKKMKALCSGKEQGVDRLAIITNGQVKSAPVLNATLGREFIISGVFLPDTLDEEDSSTPSCSQSK